MFLRKSSAAAMPSVLKKKTARKKSQWKMMENEKNLTDVFSVLDRAVSTNGSADILRGCAPGVANKPYNFAHAGTIIYTAPGGEERDR